MWCWSMAQKSLGSITWDVCSLLCLKKGMSTTINKLSHLPPRGDQRHMAQGLRNNREVGSRMVRTPRAGSEHSAFSFRVRDYGE